MPDGRCKGCSITVRIWKFLNKISSDLKKNKKKDPLCMGVCLYSTGFLCKPNTFLRFLPSFILPITLRGGMPGPEYIFHDDLIGMLIMGSFARFRPSPTVKGQPFDRNLWIE